MFQSPQALQEPQKPIVDFQPYLLWTFANFTARYGLPRVASAVDFGLLVLLFAEDNSEAIAILNI